MAKIYQNLMDQVSDFQSPRTQDDLAVCALVDKVVDSGIGAFRWEPAHEGLLTRANLVQVVGRVFDDETARVPKVRALLYLLEKHHPDALKNQDALHDVRAMVFVRAHVLRKPDVMTAMAQQKDFKVQRLDPALRAAGFRVDADDAEATRVAKAARDAIFRAIREAGAPPKAGAMSPQVIAEKADDLGVTQTGDVHVPAPSAPPKRRAVTPPPAPPAAQVRAMSPETLAGHVQGSGLSAKSPYVAGGVLSVSPTLKKANRGRQFKPNTYNRKYIP